MAGSEPAGQTRAISGTADAAMLAGATAAARPELAGDRAEAAAVAPAGRRPQPPVRPEQPAGPDDRTDHIGWPRPGPLRLDWHRVAGPALGSMRWRAPGAGLILGADRDRQPVLVPLFQPAPVRLAAVGGAWLAQVLALRALALGSRVVVLTHAPARWDTFDERLTGSAGLVTVLPPPARPELTATERRPALVIYDSEPDTLALLPGGPWQAHLVLVPHLTADTAPLLRGAALVLLERLSAGEAGVAAGALWLDDQTAQLLQALEPDMLAVFSAEDSRYVWLTPTQVESRFLGPAGRR
jgi:hypothetical protein